MRLIYVLYGFGILLSVAGVGFLAAEYVRFMSDIGKLVALLLTVAMFSFLTRYFEEVGYWMLTTLAVLLTLGLIGWLIARGLRSQPVKAHHITFALAVLSGVYTVAYFLSLDFPQIIKIVLSIFLGVALIFYAAYLQRRQGQKKGPRYP